MSKTFSVIGGDMRQLRLCDGIKKRGFIGSTYGFDCQIQNDITLSEALKAEVIVLPLPITSDGETLAMPLSNQSIALQYIFENVKKSSVLFGGRIPKEVMEMAKNIGVTLFDYFEREELMILNAIPTVEGALGIAFAEMGTTLHSSRSLVMGYGRIGKLLCKCLSDLGSPVTVAARKYSDLAWIKAYGHDGVHFNDFTNHLQEYDVIFNTIPYTILGENELKLLKKECLVVDLASKPGGIDFKAAAGAGVKCIWALSLPGKVAPITSGEIILETILNILRERGETL